MVTGCYFSFEVCLFVIDFSSVFESSNSDLDENGSSLNVRFHLEIIAFQPSFYDIVNACTAADAGQDISITVTVSLLLPLYCMGTPD